METLTLSHTLSHTLTRSHTHTHTHTLTHTLSHRHTLTHTLSHRDTHRLTLTLIYSRSHTQLHTLILSLTFCLLYSHPPQVRFGQQKRYQDWFQRQYLSTAESQSLRCDLIRYICGVVHPSNEVLSSDILPRWAIIGWLLTTCTVRGGACDLRCCRQPRAYNLSCTLSVPTPILPYYLVCQNNILNVPRHSVIIITCDW